VTVTIPMTPTEALNYLTLASDANATAQGAIALATLRLALARLNTFESSTSSPSDDNAQPPKTRFRPIRDPGTGERIYELVEPISTLPVQPEPLCANEGAIGRCCIRPRGHADPCKFGEKPPCENCGLPLYAMPLPFCARCRDTAPEDRAQPEALPFDEEDAALAGLRTASQVATGAAGLAKLYASRCVHGTNPASMCEHAGCRGEER